MTAANCDLEGSRKMLGKPFSWQDSAALQQLNMRSSAKIPQWSCQSMSWTRPWLSRSGAGNSPPVNGLDKISPGASLHFMYSCRILSRENYFCPYRFQHNSHTLLHLKQSSLSTARPKLKFWWKIACQQSDSAESQSLRALQETKNTDGGESNLTTSLNCC